ncbi:hypothetical protein ACIQ4Z_04050 [Peribacillus asahii]|uniref:hypothetical protein n=1 Tax=Peribacillus asahii TaxID=228899 RepID=UPI0038002AC4
MDKNNAIQKKAVIAFISIISISWIFWMQITHVNRYAASWDQVDFVLALERYDLMAMQPHFPGYPYFILGGYLIHFFLENKAASLTVFNILFYFSALFPMYKLAREYVSKSYSLLIAAILYSSTYIMVIANQPMSEGAAIAALWWYFWSINHAIKKNRLLSNILPLFVFSILLGIRLSYLPFAIGLLLLFYIKWRNKQYRLRHIIVYLLIAGAFQFIWVVGLVLSEGSIKGFLKLSLAFTSGHFNSWGNTAVSSDVSFLTRLKTIVINNVLWTGISSQIIWLAILYAVVIGLFIYSFKWNDIKRDSSMQLAIIMSSSYFIWVVIGQNIDKPRHILPLVIFLLFIMLINILKNSRNTVLLLFFIVLLISQIYHSYTLVTEQAQANPATYQLANYLQSHEQSAIIYTWEETRVLEYVNVPISHKRVKTFEIFLHDISYYPNKKILITNKVVEGFKAQGINVNANIKKIKEFHSNSIFDPVYHDIVLYEWIK